MLGQTLVGDDLREDGDGDLARRDRADVQADRGADAGKAAFVEAFFLEHFEQSLRAPPRADHTQVRGPGPRQQHPQAVRVMPVAAGNDHHIVKGRDLEPPDAVFKAVAKHLRRLREAGPVGKVRPVVHDTDREAALRANFADRQRDVPAAEDDQPLLGQHGLPHDKAVLRCLRRYAGKAPALRVRHRRDLGQAAAQPVFDDAAFAGYYGFQCNSPVFGQMVENVPIDVFHADPSIL